jgi:integrase
MFANPAWTVTRVLTRRELATVLADARAQAERSLNAQRNLVIVRLECCCGLRVSEIGQLRLDDVNVDGARPHIRLRRETTKGKKAMRSALVGRNSAEGSATGIGESSIIGSR